MYREDTTDESQMSTNAYWDRRAVDMDADLAAAKVKTSAERLDSLHNAVAYMSMDRPDYAERLAELNAEIATLEDEIAAAFAAEWTAETTAVRRAEYNAAALAGEDVRNWSATHGWTRDELIEAVALYR